MTQGNESAARAARLGRGGAFERRSPRLATICGWPIVVTLLVVHFGLALSSVWRTSPAFDELAFLTGGFSYWKTADYRLNPEGGILPQRWAAVPLLFGDYRLPSLHDLLPWRISDPWNTGFHFFYRAGNDLDAMLFRARVMIAMLGVGLGWLIYAWSRHLFGPVGGLISLSLYAFCPSLVAHGALVTGDLTLAFTLTAAVWCVWSVLHRVGGGSMVGTSVVLAALFLSKVSALLIIPIGCLLAGVRLLRRQPLTVSLGRSWDVTARWKQALVLLGVAGVQLVAVALLVWAGYGFRYAMFRFEQPGRDAPRHGTWEEVLEELPRLGPAIDFARRRHLLPEAYLYGLASNLGGAEGRNAFLNGQYSNRGWWYFFPYSVLVKTPVAGFAILLLAAAAAGQKWRAAALGAHRARWAVVRQDVYRLSPLLVLSLVYWAFALRSSLNIGHRHILPVYPALFILAGAAASWVALRARTAGVALAILVGLFAAESLSVWPHYLAYFNPLAGGPRQGYRHLVDSSLDWGQDLPGLKRWLDQHAPPGPGRPPVYLSYFGLGEPDYYQIRAIRLPSHLDPFNRPRNVALTGGIYCISATMLQAVYGYPRWRWSASYEQTYQQVSADVERFERAREDAVTRERLVRDKGSEFWDQTFAEYESLRFGRLRAFLRQREPDDHVGYSILIYRVTDDDVTHALSGPPAELVPDPQAPE